MFIFNLVFSSFNCCFNVNRNRLSYRESKSEIYISPKNIYLKLEEKKLNNKNRKKNTNHKINSNNHNNNSYINNGIYNHNISDNNNIIINKDLYNNQQNQTHLRGLVNIASTCYMNSILQCFSHIPKLYNYFQKEEISDIANELYSENLLFPVFREVLVELWNKSINSPYSPNKFKERLGEMNPLFKGAYPNDAKDLLTFILIQLHEELNQ